MDELLRKFEEMCETAEFDTVCAEEVLSQIDVNQEFIPSVHRFRVTPLS